MPSGQGERWYDRCEDLSVLRAIIRELETRVLWARTLLSAQRYSDLAQFLQDGEYPAGPVWLREYRGEDPDRPGKGGQ